MSVAEQVVHTEPALGGAMVQLASVCKSFTRGNQAITVLQDLDLTVQKGAFEALMGPSGSGKSTLLHLIAGLDRATSGQVVVAGSNLTQMSDVALAKFRARYVGFIFQTYNLLPVLTALENVQLPLLMHRMSAAERRQRAETALRVVGLEQRMHHRPNQLSGGQEQRVAIARALITDPAILVCDEPTGDLDRDSADDIVTLLETLNREFKKTIVVVTHDPMVAERTGVTRRLDKGRLK